MTFNIRVSGIYGFQFHGFNHTNEEVAAYIILWIYGLLMSHVSVT